MKAASIAEDELYKAIEESLIEQREPGLEPGTTTTPRIMERFHIGRVKANRLVAKFVVEGRLVHDRILLTDGWGSQQRIRGFRWVENGEKDQGETS